jgi:hypothetical protein
MSNFTRELLLTTKSARQWRDTFDEQVNSIIETINKIDTLEEVARTTEVLDVYHHTALHAATATRRRRRMVYGDRPFEFLAFQN